MPQYLDIVEVGEISSQGTTEPVKCMASDGRWYFVKGIKATKEGLRCEFIAAAIGRRLGLPIPPSAILRMDPVLLQYALSEEVKSLGLEILFGSQWEDQHCQWIDEIGFDAIDEDMQVRILFFDLLVNNIDRTSKNPNLLWSFRRRGPVVIDHNLAFDTQATSREIARGHCFSERKDQVVVNLDCCRRFIDKDMAKLNMELAAVLDSMPSEWYDYDDERQEFKDKVMGIVSGVIGRLESLARS